MPANFWNHLESKKLTDKDQVAKHLMQKLGAPPNQLSTNCLQELTKKIVSYYHQTEAPKNYTIYSLVGSLTSPEQIIERKFKEGKRFGQTYYLLLVGQEKLQACQENLPANKWTQITKLALLGKNLVFKYKKWITNKELLDFSPYEKEKGLKATTKARGKPKRGVELVG